MKNLIQNKAFTFGFLLGFLSFIFTMNYFDKKDRGICFDCYETFGLPFNYLGTGGFVTRTDILWFGLIADILIAIVFGLIIGSIFKFVWLKIASRRLNLK